MNFSNHLIFVAVAILVVSKTGSSEKNGSSKSRESIFEEAIAEGKQHRAYDETQQNLQQQSSAAVNDNEANHIILDRLSKLIYNIRLSAETAYDCLNETHNSLNKSSEVTTENLNICFDKANEFVIKAGAYIYWGLGAVTEILGNQSRQVLNEAIQLSTGAGSITIAGLSVTRKLATQGASAGGNAFWQALLAACRSVQTTEKANYNLIEKTAKRAYDAVDNKSMPKEENSQAKERATARSPECQDAIEKIKKSAHKVSSEVTSKNKLQAIKVVRDGFIDTLKTIANALEKSYNAIDEAKQIQNKEQAFDIVSKGIDASKNGCLVAGATAQQTLGAAAYITGPKAEEPIVKAMIKTDTSRVALSDGLENSFQILSLGIRNDLLEIALKAAREGVATAEYSAYSIIVKSAEIANNAIVLAQPE